MKLGPLHMIMSKEFVSNIYHDISSTSDQKLLDTYNKKRNKIAEMLLKAGANVNQKDIFDRTPVFFANAISSVKLLIKEGADLNITDKFGRSVLLAAVSMENHKQLTQYYIKTMKFLKPDECQSTVFHYVAILQRELDIFDYLEGKFVKCDYLECKDRNGKTPYEVSRFKLQSEINKKFKHSLLKQRGVGAPWDDKESELIKRTVINFAEELCKAIGEKDKRLICTLQRSGSSEEGTKIGDLNEFDFIFCMGEIQKLCTVDDVNIEEEFVTLNANKDIPQTFTVFFNSEGRCKISEVRLAFSRAVKTIVLDEHIWKSKDIILWKLKNSEESDKPVVTLEIRLFGCAYKDEIISIDLVPAIRKTEWWPTKGGRCELLNQNDRIKNKGCLLLFQTKYFVQSETLMRISCSPVETELLKNVLPLYFLEGYRHCKLIYLWLVNNHSSNIHIQNCIKNNLLTSYMFKNCLFYVYENYKMEEKPLTPENSEVAAIELVDDILSCLQSFNEKCTFPVYVIPEREDIFVIKSFKQYSLREDSKTITTHHCKTREHVIKYMQEIHSGEKF
ncbi:uncharacterized protein LOC127736738 [Mytilus californianus]|uniref:uncharacterized protein LOC127736738 n=1 Tax=Mytilus californianus TaxID=6549 RepID=UPI00224653D9|nr:uncharacterized protein LOC127736738 [Mytilus californianus]